jgi:hypothetical protein
MGNAMQQMDSAQSRHPPLTGHEIMTHAPSFSFRTRIEYWEIRRDWKRPPNWRAHRVSAARGDGAPTKRPWVCGERLELEALVVDRWSMPRCN